MKSAGNSTSQLNVYLSDQSSITSDLTSKGEELNISNVGMDASSASASVNIETSTNQTQMPHLGSNSTNYQQNMVSSTTEKECIISTPGSAILRAASTLPAKAPYPFRSNKKETDTIKRRAIQ